jgi:hypothetical protein
MSWHWWKQTEVIASINDLIPRLASWNAKSHPDQTRLREYRCSILAALGTLPPGDRLSVHLQIDAGSSSKLLLGCDLENYLFPLFESGCLPPRRFVLATASKQVGGGSRLIVGRAEAIDCEPAGWQSFTARAGSGSSQKLWKERLRSNLASAGPTAVPPGPVAVHLAWRCASRRNWSLLWKPTGDSLGPVLGEPHPSNPFNPSDDRIVNLGLHLMRDDSQKHDVEVGMWWKHFATAI